MAFGRGPKVLLYVVYQGQESNRLDRRVIRLVGEIEERFAPLLRDWDGDIDRISVLRGCLARVWDMPQVGVLSECTR